MPGFLEAMMDPIHIIQLSGKWSFTSEGGKTTEIEVPGGGWLKQGFDCEAATYERDITIPDTEEAFSYMLEFGAVNHESRVFIGQYPSAMKCVHQEVTAFTGQSVNLTGHVEPGQSYIIRVEVRAFRDGRPIAPHWAEWCESIARGLFRSVDLFVCPIVFIEDIFIRSSIENRTLQYDVWVRNNGTAQADIVVGSNLAATDGAKWTYPGLPPIIGSVPAGTSISTVSPTLWPSNPCASGLVTKMRPSS